jgi:hypothetical protein
VERLWLRDRHITIKYEPAIAQLVLMATLDDGSAAAALVQAADKLEVRNAARRALHASAQRETHRIGFARIAGLLEVLLAAHWRA